MKLLFFSPYYPPHIGGLEAYADELNKYLSRDEIGITVFTPHLPSISPAKETLHSNISVIRFPAWEIVHNYPLPKFWKGEFKKELSSLEADLVVSHTRFFYTSMLAYHYAKKKKVPWIHIEHGSDFVQSGGFWVTLLAKIYDLTIGKVILKKCDRVVAISKAVQEFVLKLQPQAKCQTIYRGFDPQVFENILPDQNLKSQYADKTILIFVGRLISGKGVATLIQAFATLSLENTVLFIVGDGPEKENLINLATKLNCREKIVFLGHQPFEKTISILKISDIFINPSFTEGLPTAVIEAALCGKAIIATNVGGTREIVDPEMGGILVAPRDVATLTSAMEKLISDPLLREKMATQSQASTLQKFNWKNTIAQFNQLFQELLKK